jgi:hypothetical protein
MVAQIQNQGAITHPTLLRSSALSSLRVKKAKASH